MADYRFSAQVIKRSDGKSAVAAAAYRSGERLLDERTGTVCDYTRKGGVIHSEIVTPANTPDWMHDRAQLWNTVEAVERRKDAQLAREIQLSLPHELTDDQRKALVMGFVQEQFVARGMIADIAIHAPSAAGDIRNHHAHVMLTMRSLIGDGFGNKERDWNSPDQLAVWREQWAHHQNRDLERHGHPARVDHRSYEAQGVDREPTQHLGPVASDMERNGKASRIGDENRQAANDNTARAHDHIAAARLASDKARFETWAHEKKAELEAAQQLTALDLAQKHDHQKFLLEERLERDNGRAKATIKAEIQTLDRKLEAKGVRKLLRTVFGRERTDQQARQDMAASLRDIETREAEQRQALEVRQDKDRANLAERQEARKVAQERGIDRAAKRAEDESRQKSPQKPIERDNAPTPSQDMAKATNDNPRPPEPQDGLGLDDRKLIADVRLEQMENRTEGKSIERPWRRATLSNDNDRPWRRDDAPPGRERKPDKSREPK